MSRMRPHTRTQCQDGNPNQCPECCETPSGLTSAPESDPHSGSTSGGNNDSAGSGPSAGPSSASNTGSDKTGNDPFVAPTGTVSRRAASTSVIPTSKQASQPQQGSDQRALLLVELPAEILFKILSHMSFKEISHLRMVIQILNPLLDRI